jgi:hypothetical protein
MSSIKHSRTSKAKGGTLSPKMPQKVIINNTYRTISPSKSKQVQYDPKTNTIVFSQDINAGDLLLIQTEHGIEKRYVATKYFANTPYHQNEIHAYPIFKPFKIMKINQRFLDTVKLQSIVGYKTNDFNKDAVKPYDNKYFIYNDDKTAIAFNQPISKNDTLQLLGDLYVKPINNLTLGFHKTIRVKNVYNSRLPSYKVDIRTIMKYEKPYKGTLVAMFT